MEFSEQGTFGDFRNGAGWFGRVECTSRCCVPHPSCGITKFWQGRLEIVLRLLSAIFAGIILFPSLWIMIRLKIPYTEEEAVNSSQSESHKVLIWAILSAGFGFLLQPLIISGRFLNFEFAIIYNSLFRILDVVASVVIASAFFTLSIPIFVFCVDLGQLMEAYPSSDFSPYFPALRRSYMATAVLCCLAFIQYLFLSIWMSVSLSFHWDNKLRRHLQLPPSSDTPNSVSPPPPESTV